MSSSARASGSSADRRPPPRPPSPPPPPPPVSVPSLALPLLSILTKAQPRLPSISEDLPVERAGSVSSTEEVAVPARQLCRMSIASLVDDRRDDDDEHEITSQGDESADSGSSDTTAIPVAVNTPRSAYVPLSSASEENRLYSGHLKRRWSLSSHVFDDDISSSDDNDDATYARLSDPSPPPAKQQKKTALPPQSTTTKPAMAASSSGTLVVYQPTCLDHHNDDHQENRARLTALCGPDGILQKPRFRALRWANLRELKPARLGDILRVHSFQYIQHLDQVCAGLPPQTSTCTVGTFFEDAPPPDLDGKKLKTASSDYEDATSPLFPNDWVKTKQAQKCYAAVHPPSSGHFDNDAPISRQSYQAARLAAGAVCHAIDKVVHGETRNAFVAVRPPGHHAGPNGCVESASFHRRPEMCTCGFCLLNNVAIGAAYAMATYSGSYYGPAPTPEKPTIERVAIIDFDIHHGNGTEEILRNLVPHQQPYPLPSSWAPVSFPSYKPWRDERDVDNVFFASIHLHDGDNIYPCSGMGPNGDSPELRDHENIMNLPLEFIGPRYLEERERLTVKAKKSLMDRASRAFRERVSTQLIPALRKFQPDLVLLSAGFDGHADDFYYYLAEGDYEWMTEQLAQVANECCDGRLVSVLEGGYNVELSTAQKRKLNAKKKAKKRSGSTSNSSSPAASPARSTRTEGEDEEDEDDQPASDDEELVYGALARSCAAHVMALQRAGNKN